MKIEQNYLLFLIHLNSADLGGNSQRLYLTKITLQKMRKTAMEKDDIKHSPNKDNACLKLRCYDRECFLLQKLFVDRSGLGFQSFPERSRKIVTN